VPKVRDIVEAIERFAPLSLQAEYDNCGLLVGDPDQDIHGVLIALDTNPDVVAEAAEKGCGLIIEHHPTLFRPLRKIDFRLPLHHALCSAIKNDIAIYAAHTSVDFAPGGLNDTFAALIGCTCIKTLGTPDAARIGDLPQAVTLAEFAKKIALTLNAENVDTVGDPDILVRRVAVINGAGGGDEDALLAARDAGADIFVTAELKYHVVRLAKDIGYGIISVGHYDSEASFAKLMCGVLGQAGYGEFVSCANSLQNPYNDRRRQ